MQQKADIQFIQKKSQSGGCYDVVMIFFCAVGVGALILFFSLISPDDLGDYAFELILVTVMMLTFVYHMFKPKAAHLNKILTLTRESLVLSDIVNIPLTALQIDLYKDDEKFGRYHLWDKDGKLAIFSLIEDDLLKTLLSLDIPVRTFGALSANSSDEEVVVKTKSNHTLQYNLETGEYKIISGETTERELLPQFSEIDPNFTIINNEPKKSK